MVKFKSLYYDQYKIDLSLSVSMCYPTGMENPERILELDIDIYPMLDGEAYTFSGRMISPIDKCMTFYAMTRTDGLINDMLKKVKSMVSQRCGDNPGWNSIYTVLLAQLTEHWLVIDSPTNIGLDDADPEKLKLKFLAAERRFLPLN